jgi:hypothetical protein
MTDSQMILVAGKLMVAGLVASLAAGRLRVPGLVLFLGLGMAIGSAAALQDVARRRLTRKASDADRAWLREIIGALARGS